MRDVLASADVLSCCCSGVHDATFATRIPIQHIPDQDVQYRFSLYDLDHDERVTNEEVVGETWVSSRQLIGGAQFQQPLKKNGVVVPDLAIVFNSTEKPTAAVAKPVQIFTGAFTTFTATASCV
jgi:hypothetical protein